MIMKNVLRTISVVILSFFAVSAFSQQRGMRNMDPEESSKMQLATMKEIIEINDKEAEKVQEVFLKYAKERKKLFEGMQEGGDREAMREKMQEMVTKMSAELEKIIGKERNKTYTDELAKRRAERQRN